MTARPARSVKARRRSRCWGTRANLPTSRTRGPASAAEGLSADDLTGTIVGTPVMVNVVNGAISTPYTVPAGTPAGRYTVAVDFGGSNDFVDSSDSTHQLTIQPAATTTTTTVVAVPFSASDRTVAVSTSVAARPGRLSTGR